MTSITHTRLDPRLRRLVQSVDEDSAQLSRDLSRGFVTSTSDSAPPEEALKRVLVALRGGKIPGELESLEWINIVDSLYTVNAPVRQLRQLALAPEVEYAEAGRDLSPSLDTSVPETRADAVRNPPGMTGLDGTGVVVGIIDFGLDFTLDDFRDQGGRTRISPSKRRRENTTLSALAMGSNTTLQQ